MNLEQLKQAIQFSIPFIVLDTETTGLTPGGIVEIAAQKFRGNDVVAEFHSIVDPGCPISQDAVFIHGISHEMVKNEGRPYAEVMPEFLEFCGNATLVGHNIDFDLKFINHHLRQIGLPDMSNPKVDTLIMARRHVSLGISNNQLSTIAEYFGVDSSGAHRAMKDVDMTRQIFVKMLGA